MGSACSCTGLGDALVDRLSKASIYVTPRVIFVGCLSVFSYTWYVYNIVFLGRILLRVNKHDYVHSFFWLFNTLWTLTLWSYLRASFTDPGRLTDEWRSFTVQTQGSADLNVGFRFRQRRFSCGEASSCPRCREVSPERAHHCRECNACILRMDHHCPWIGNCVGFRNHKFFLLLAAYGLAASLVVLVTISPELFGWSDLACSDCLVTIGSFLDDLLLSILGLVTTLLVLFLGFVSSYHWRLVLANCTTIETWYDNANPYTFPDRIANVSQVFGAPGVDWVLPLMPLQPQTDGFSFARRSEVLPSELTSITALSSPGLALNSCFAPDSLSTKYDTKSFWKSTATVSHASIRDLWVFRYSRKVLASPTPCSVCFPGVFGRWGQRK